MRILKSHPILGLVNSYVIDSPQPSNLSYAWNGGSLLGLCLVTQLATGIFLAMHYIASADLAFISVESIMRDVNSGWMIRYIHANTASLFFAIMYLHIARGMWYGSYGRPRTLVWSIGVIILVLLIITAFLGYRHSPKWESIYSIKNRLNPKYSYSNEPKNNPSSKEEIINEFLTLKNLNPYAIYSDLTNPLTRTQIKNDTKELSGIYLLLNLVTLDYYIGSASTNRLSIRYANHLINFTGSKVVKNAVRKYGLDSFVFIVLEVSKDTTTRENNKDLLNLEDFYLKSLLPNYNILTEAGNSFGYKHTEMDRIKMKANYSEERRLMIKNLNFGKSLSLETKEKLQKAALNRNWTLSSEGLAKIILVNSDPVTVLNKNDGTVYGRYSSVLETANALKCHRKTVQRALASKTHILLNRYIVKKEKPLN